MQNGVATGQFNYLREDTVCLIVRLWRAFSGGLY